MRAHDSRLLSLFLALFLLAAAVSACRDREASAPPTPERAAAPASPPQETVAAGPQPAVRRQGWIGVIVSRNLVDVASPWQGRLAAVYVETGDTVRAGDPIAVLDTQVLRQDLEIARSGLRAAQADEERAKAEMNEARARFERRQANPDFFSKEDLAEAELRARTAASALEGARARVAEQRTRVQQLETELGQSQIRAPFAGRVAERFEDPGSMIGPANPVVRLISGGDLMVRAAVPPEEAQRLAPGVAVTVRVRDLGIAVPGRIESIAPEVDTASQMVFVEARLTPSPEVERRLQTGLVVDVSTP